MKIEDEEYYGELSEYLAVLSSPVRLKILKLIEKKPRDIREIASEINLSYENTKRHIDKLVSTTIVKKEPGLGRETVKGSLPVWKYSLYPGGFESVVRNLGLFGNLGLNIGGGELSKRIAEVRNEILDDYNGIPVLAVLFADNRKEIFPVFDSRTRIGRFDGGVFGPEKEESVWQIPASSSLSEGSIIFSSKYDTITRISKPHGIIQRRDEKWYYMDCGSTGGSYACGKALACNKLFPLSDGDIITVSKWPDEIKLIFSYQKAGKQN